MPENFKLDFAIIGAQKASTTALASYLSQHPQLYLPETKETHFFRRPIKEEKMLDRNIEHLTRHYTGRLAGQKCGDATPAYIYWPGSLELLHAHNSQILSILSVRNPVWRAYSAWSMEVRRGRETLPFSDAIRAGRSRVTSAPFGIHPTFSYVERGFYFTQAIRCLEVFPRSQIFALRSDQVRATDTRMSELLGFLGVDAFQFSPIEENMHPGIFEMAPGLQSDFDYLYDLFIEDMHDFQQLGLIDISDWLVGPPSVDVAIRRADGARYA